MTQYKDLQSKSLYQVQIQKNTEQIKPPDNLGDMSVHEFYLTKSSPAIEQFPDCCNDIPTNKRSFSLLFF